MEILALFNTAGWIFGPAMFLAGIVAIVLCLRAGWRGRTSETVRVALLFSLLPLLIGFCGTLTGLILHLAGFAPLNWHDLAKVTLAGYVVSAIPLLWSATYCASILRHGTKQ